MRNRSFLASLTLTALGASCGSSPNPSTGEGLPPNVVFACIDTLRADHLGCYGHQRDTSPRLDELAARSLLFRDASAAACWTKPSVPSFLTGTYPLQHGVYQGSSDGAGGARSDVLPDAAWTVAEAYSEAGYQTAAFVRNAQLRRGLGFEQGFDTYVDEAGDAREIRWQAVDWLHDRDAARPFFLYLHFLDAHWPYDIPDTAARRWARPEGVEWIRDGDWKTVRDAINGGELQPTPAQRQDMLALYDGAIRFVDGELGRLFDELERLGVAERTIVCLLSDHGEDFMEHGRIGHGHGLYETLLRVPWILHVPGRPAGIVETPVSLIDVLPTLLAASGLRVGDARAQVLAGIDRLAEPGSARPILAEHMGKYDYEQSIRRAQAKLVVESVRTDQGSEERQVDLEVGARYEVKLATSEEGSTLALALEEDDGDPDDAPELKGVARSVGTERMLVAGLPVALPAGVELYGETEDADGRPRALADGILVKAKGRFEGGTFVPEKIKLYEADAKVEEELRATLTSVEAARLEFGGAWLPLADDADLPTTSGRPRMTRETVHEAALVEDGAPSPLSSHGKTLALDQDPLERAPTPGAPVELDKELRAASRRLASTRYWGTEDTAALGHSELEDLRAIGYADGDDE